MDKNNRVKVNCPNCDKLMQKKSLNKHLKKSCKNKNIKEENTIINKVVEELKPVLKELVKKSNINDITNGIGGMSLEKNTDQDKQETDNEDNSNTDQDKQETDNEDNSNTELAMLKKYLEDNLDENLLEQISECCFEIREHCQSDGKGLTTGLLVDKYLDSIFPKFLPEYEEYHVGEADFKINGIPISFKTINGVKSIALAWSKNKETSKRREFWNENIMIFNRITEQKWAQGPTKQFNDHDKEYYTDIMPCGFYLVNKCCQNWTKLTQNNKTNSLVDSKYVYEMLKTAKENDLFIPLPDPKGNIFEFDFSKAFSKKV
jgi:hypothetical protein